MRTLGKNGFSLVQLLLAIGLLGILAGVFADMIINLQKEVRRTSAQQGRILASYQLDQITTSPFGVRTSALLPDVINEPLRACVRGGATTGCTSNCCQGGQSFDFILLDPRDTNPNLSARARLGGTSTNPVYYDEAGSNNCIPPRCTYRVATSFVAQCPGGVAQCDHAEHLVITVAMDPEPGKEYLMRPQKRTLIHFVNINYKPFISPISDQTLTAGSTVNLSVYGNSGHPSEVQNFIFAKCSSSSSATAKVTCYGFLNGVGTMRIEPLMAGTAQITLQINDGGMENNLSDDLTFDVVVSP
ncbi:hypothetical protein [Bdellovibrio bacteriovorus]|uniref:hypothetical protein n=1 Tax=Bdellovibrio TaxID=958 RepID=UPI0035A874E5